MRAVELRGDRVLILDQTLLPHSVRVLECRTPEEVVEAIREMRVRGAPAVGMAGAMALALAALRSRGSPEERIKRMEGGGEAEEDQTHGCGPLPQAGGGDGGREEGGQGKS